MVGVEGVHWSVCLEWWEEQGCYSVGTFLIVCVPTADLREVRLHTCDQ